MSAPENSQYVDGSTARARASGLRLLLLSAIILVMSGASGGMAQHSGRLESWQACCGAACLRTVAGLLGRERSLAEIRALLDLNSTGDVSLAELVKAAQSMGLFAVGLRIRTDQLEQCVVPLIAHQPPNHFVVLLGRGRGRGVFIIDPPHTCQPMTSEDLEARRHWDVMAVSANPLQTDGLPPCHTDQHPQTQYAEARTYGPLQFDNMHWHFGEAAPDAKLEHEFTFRNTGDAPVIIDKVHPRCSCISIKEFSSPVEPGRRGSVSIVFRAGAAVGQKSERVLGTFHGDHGSQMFVLAVSGTVSRNGELRLRPDEIHLPEMVAGTAVSRTVTLTRIGAEPLDLRDIRANGTMVSADVLDPLPNAPEARIRIRVEAGHRLGPFEKRVTFCTGAPEHPEAALRIHGNVVSPVVSEPSELFLGLLRGPESLQATAMVRSRTGAPFEIMSIRSTLAQITASAMPLDDRSSIWRVTLTEEGTLPPGVLMGEILVETSDPRTGALRIPYAGLVASHAATSDAASVERAAGDDG
jgi:predicted double-glycine peptidase